MMSHGPPSSEQQVSFLRDVQRLFAEGSFVASYKFALLHALADLAVVQGDDSGAPLRIATSDIAERFIELYWRQVRPFCPADDSGGAILRQNTGKQAVIISKIRTAQRKSEGSIWRLKLSGKQWHRLIKAVEKTVREMPLWKLQTVGGDPAEFLYKNIGKGNSVLLLPGVAYCLRAYYGLLRDLIQGAWLRYIRKTNAVTLGSESELGAFLFGQERAGLAQCRPILMDAQCGRCLYCRKPLDRRSEVDHFIPWSRYPSDLGHNLVLTHATCNARKSDYLACVEHLAAWQERNTADGGELAERFAAGSLLHDLPSSVLIAVWAYGQAEQSRGHVWVSGRSFKRLDEDWRRFLLAG